MFDLEREIQQWRGELLADGLSDPELDELEDHLRSDIAEQVRSGVAVDEAFPIAVERIGRGRQLNAQFEFASASAPAKNRGGKAAITKGAIALLVACAIVVATVYCLSSVSFALKTGASLLALAFLAVTSVWIWVQRGRGTITLTSEVLLGMFPPDGQELLSLARVEARRLGHDYVGTEHLLLALTLHDGDALGQLLERVGCRREALREETETRIKACVAHRIRTRLPFTPRLNKALRLAVDEAVAGGQQVNANHFLLGLLRERTGIAGIVLRSLGFNVEQVRSASA